jgi:hypothetical protein
VIAVPAEEFEPVTWEAVIAIASISSAVVIALSAFAAVRQMRNAQRGQTFEGTETLLERWESAEMRVARRYVLDELPALLRTQAYREEILRNGARGELFAYPELTVLRFLERVGIYIYYRVLPGEAIYEQLFIYVARAWPHLIEVARLVREAENNPYAFDKAEMFHGRMMGLAERQLRKLNRALPKEERRATVNDISGPYSG